MDPTEWIRGYDKELPVEILRQCSLTDCGLCSVPLNGPAVAKSHYEGKNHEKSVQIQLAKLYADLSLAPKRIRLEGEEPPAPKVRGPRPPPKLNEDGTPVVETPFFCDICNLTCAGRLIYDSHLGGKTHASR